MRAIITQPNKDGTYDDVGMNNRTVTKNYKTFKNLIQHGIPSNFVGRLRLEIWHGENIYGKPKEVVYTYQLSKTSPSLIDW